MELINKKEIIKVKEIPKNGIYSEVQLTKSSAQTLTTIVAATITITIITTRITTARKF